MKKKTVFKSIIIILLAFCVKSFAHPNGNIIVVNNSVLWSYVFPVGDINHHACIMKWDQKSKPKPFFVSKSSSSDFFLFNSDETIYIIESRYRQQTDKFETRVLKTSVNFEEPKVIWNWFEDKWHIGAYGFKMTSDDEIVFANYPEILILKKGKTPKSYFKFNHKVNKIRPLSNGNYIVIGEGKIWITSPQGKILKYWNSLIEKLEENAPLNRNVIFDADYYNDELLIAYWGKRAFEILDKNGKRKVLLQHETPWVPHWVAFMENKKLLFATKMDFENPFNSNMTETTIMPRFSLYHNGKLTKIWQEE